MAKRFTDILERVVSMDQHKKRMIGYHGWLHYDGWDICSGKIWDFPAVYVIYLDGILSYVGQSNTPRFRFRQHGFQEIKDLIKTPWGVFNQILVKIKYSKQYGKEAMIEKRLIKRLKPRFNLYHLKQRKYCAEFK